MTETIIIEIKAKILVKTLHFNLILPGTPKFFHTTSSGSGALSTSKILPFNIKIKNNFNKKKK